MKIRNHFVVGLVSLLVLSGCSNGPSHTGAAAIVADETIAQQAVTSELKEVLDQITRSENQGQGTQAGKPDAGMLGQQIVNRLVLSKLIDRALANLKLTVTDAQVFEFQDGIYSQYGKDKVDAQLLLSQAIPASQVTNFFRLVLSEEAVAKKLAPQGSEEQSNAAFSKYLMTLADQSNISVSPRYGSWSSDQLKVTGFDNALSSAVPTE